MATLPSETFKKTCYLCNSSSMILSRNRRSISFHRLHNYYRCSECKSYSLFPKLGNEEIEELYSIKYIEDVNPEFNMNEKISGSRFLKLREILEQVENQKNTRFLDYGCGATAEVIILSSKLGFKAFGVEIEAGTRLEAHLKSSCQVFSPEEVQASGTQFDIIFLGDVLEHLCDPLVILDQLQTLLSPNGQLIIQGPLEGAITISNLLLSAKAKLFPKSPTKFPPYHVHLATRESIVKALNIYGLIIQKFVVTEPLWPAPKFGSRASFASITALIFSLVKILDIAVSKIFSNYGTRFFLTATRQ